MPISRRNGRRFGRLVAGLLPAHHPAAHAAATVHHAAHDDVAVVRRVVVHDGIGHDHPRPPPG